MLEENRITMRSYIFYILLISFTLSFYSNVFTIAPDHYFNAFQKDSESLVLGKIARDRDGFATVSSNLGEASISGGRQEVYGLLRNQTATVKYEPYESQYGLQGKFYSFLYNNIKFDSINTLTLFCSLLTAFSILIYLSAVNDLWGRGVSLAFGTSLFLSPWVTSMSSNLYWSPFIWFFIIAAGFKVAQSVDKSKAYFYVLIFGILVFLKSLMGYEYLSTLFLMAFSPLLLLMCLSGDKYKKIRIIKILVLMASVGVLGFVIALLMHADIRADSISEGLKAIWEKDILRRTYSNPEGFSKAYRASLTATPVDVINKYVFSWHTPLIKGVSGKAFSYLIFIAAVIVLYGAIKRSESWKTDLSLFVILIVAPISWFVLAKSHSQAHGHINYILWYFGFVGILFYIVGKKTLFLFKKTCVLFMSKKLLFFIVVASVILFSLIKDEYDHHVEYLALIDSNQYLTRGEERIGVVKDTGVYIDLDNKLLLRSTVCSPGSNYEKFFLHVRFKGSEEFVNLDFYWHEKVVDKDLFFGSSLGCVAVVELGESKNVKELRVGQFSGNKRSWQLNYNVHEKMLENGVVAVDLTDNRWANGVSINSPVFFIKGNAMKFNELKAFSSVMFSYSGSRAISDIKLNGDYINIRVLGGRLDPFKDGFPNRIMLGK